MGCIGSHNTTPTRTLAIDRILILTNARALGEFLCGALSRRLPSIPARSLCERQAGGHAERIETGTCLVIVDAGKTGFADLNKIRRYTSRRNHLALHLVDEGAAARGLDLTAGSIAMRSAGLETFMSVIADIVSGGQPQPVFPAEPCQAQPAESPVTAFNLTKRELEIVAHVLKGRENRRIADELGTSIGNVKRLVSSVLAKMEVNSRLGIVAALSSQAATPVDTVFPGLLDTSGADQSSVQAAGTAR